MHPSVIVPEAPLACFFPDIDVSSEVAFPLPRLVEVGLHPLISEHVPVTSTLDVRGVS